MNNRKLEYNPLFESLADTARRYERINEEVSPEVKIKYAKEYAKKILDAIYQQYVYFVYSIPDSTLKQTAIKEALTFIQGLSAKTTAQLSLETIVDEFTKKWDAIETSSQDIDAMKKAPILKDIYADVNKGMEEIKNAVKVYLEKYGTEASSNAVLTDIKTFVDSAKTSMEQKK